MTDPEDKTMSDDTCDWTEQEEMDRSRRILADLLNAAQRHGVCCPAHTLLFSHCLRAIADGLIPMATEALGAEGVAHELKRLQHCVRVAAVTVPRDDDETFQSPGGSA